MGFFGKAETWVLVSFILFVALLVYLKVPAKLARMLDDRSAKIAKELDEAKKLREEAASLLAECNQKHVRAEDDARAIIAQAKTDAEEFAVEARRKLSESIERRTRQAEQKIAQAEANAVKDVRNAVAEMAIAAAASLSAGQVKAGKAGDLIADSITAVKAKLN